MRHQKSSRRTFIASSAVGLTSLASAAGLSKQEHSAAEKKLSVVCIGAHPGDPEFGCGGTLLKYGEYGHRVTVLYLTRGEASDPKKSFSEMADLRTKEAEVACGILKVTPVFAGQIDGNTQYNNDTGEQMTRLIMAQKPDVVFTHWPLDGHKDHQIAGLLTLNTWTKSGKVFDLYFYEVNTGDESMNFMPTDYEDISAYRERKKSALMKHRTQNPGEVYDRFFKTMEEFRGLEAGVSAAEAFVHFKSMASRATTL